MYYTVHGKIKEVIVSSKQELADFIKKEVSHEYSEIWLIQKIGKIKGVERFIYKVLGLQTDIKGLSLYILIKDKKAVLVFLDEDDNETIAIDTKYDGPANAKEEFILNSGQVSVHSADECIQKDKAIKAMLHFFEQGKRPNWLKYR